jgi:acyl dehydratase
MPGLWFEEYEVGKVYRHRAGRTVTETDNLLFTTLSMNPAPLHLDAEYAKTLPYGRQLVTSVFTLGVVMGMSVSDLFEGTSLGNLGFSTITFPAPVFIGDTLRAETEVVAKRASKSRPEAGIVTVIHRGYNQSDVLVMEAQRTGLSLKRPATDAAAGDGDL